MDSNLYKQLKIDLFLKQIQVLSQTNKITPKQVYIQLINQEIVEKERSQDLSDVFNNLQIINKYNDKMDVFVNPNWNYFCQLISKNVKQFYHMNPIKIYIPLKYENIESSVQRIFTFINSNNIEHCSKLSRQVRVDDLVIRVYNKNDADKIIEFVNNDEELSNNMYNPNAFCINEGKVGLTMDRNLSYNETLSQYICDYISIVNDQNIFANYYGFQNYLEDELNQLVVKEEISKQILMCQKKERRIMPQYLQTLEEITKVILMNMKSLSKDSFYNYFDEINTEEYNKQKSEEYKDFVYQKMMNESYLLFKEVVSIIANKYGYKNTKEALENYKNTGDINYITRTNNAREKVSTSKTFKTFINLINLEKEIDRLMPKFKEREIRTPKEIILEEVCKTTYEVCQVPERNYCGKAQVARALIRMHNNDYMSITRTNKARKMAQEHIKPEEVPEILKRSLETNGYIIENESDLYELYATHIEYLCSIKNLKRGRN